MSIPPGTSTTNPLAMRLDLTCPVEHAFAIWTTRIGTWWPTDHTASGCPEQIVLQGHVSTSWTEEPGTVATSVGAEVAHPARLHTTLPKPRTLPNLTRSKFTIRVLGNMKAALAKCIPASPTRRDHGSRHIRLTRFRRGVRPLHDPSAFALVEHGEQDCYVVLRLRVADGGDEGGDGLI